VPEIYREKDYVQTHRAAILAYSVLEFCHLHNIGRATFYRLLQAGKGPRLMRVGKRTLISSESAAEWRRSMEQAAGPRTEA
jgi:hypothetical protein